MDSQYDLANIEKRRVQLENNIAKLTTSLHHWQQWEIEYDGMKEELLGLGEGHTQQAIQNLEDDNEETLSGSPNNFLDTKERNLLLYHKGKLRSAKTIIDLSTKRVDYVQQNVQSIYSLLKNAEEELAASIAATNPKTPNGSRLPVTEIHEELDEDGNVISSILSHPDESAPLITEALRKAGVKYSPDGKSTDVSEYPHGDHAVQQENDTSHTSSDASPVLAEQSDGPRRTQTDYRNSDIQTSDSSGTSSDSTRRRPGNHKKRVSFAEGTKPEPSPSDHPQNLPKEEQKALLREVCAQIRSLLGRNFKKKKMYEQLRAVDTFSKRYHTSMALSSFLEHETVEPTLKQHQNRQARRLLKSNNLNLWEASRVLYIMTEIEDYDLQSPQIVDTISALKKMHDYAPNIDLTKSNGADTLSAKDLEIANNKAFAATKCLEDYASESAVLKNTKRAAPTNDKLGRKSDQTKEQLAQEDEYSSSVAIKSPQIPNDETAEEANIRRQMLAYNMNEVGAVVAELNLDNDDDLSEGSYSNDDHMDIEDSSDEAEDEDQHGRTSSRVLTAAYLEEMKSLENKLKARAMVNAGPNGSTIVPTTSAMSEIPANDNDVSASAMTRSKTKGVKRVSFAEDLDIQESPASPKSTDFTKKQRHSNSFDDPVIEHESPEIAETTAETPKKKLSRFKAARGGQNAPPAPSTREKATIQTTTETKKTLPINAANIVERPYNPTAKASEPDDLDPIRVNQQVNSEYHRLRNRMIEKEGGFLKPDERTEIPAEEDLEGGKKISRFRAARLGLQ